MLVCLVALLASGCGNSERGDDTGVIRRVKRARQAKLKPHDFAFAKLQVQEGEKDGLFGTCVHIPMRDAAQRTHDCSIGVTLPIHVRNEKWPRDEETAARYVARAANAVRKHLLDFVHADAFTCRAYFQQIRAYLNNGDKRQRETWKGADTLRCSDYKGASLPDFHHRSGHLLIGDYREWSKQTLSP